MIESGDCTPKRLVVLGGGPPPSAVRIDSIEEIPKLTDSIEKSDAPKRLVVRGGGCPPAAAPSPTCHLGQLPQAALPPTPGAAAGGAAALGRDCSPCSAAAVAVSAAVAGLSRCRAHPELTAARHTPPAATHTGVPPT